MTGTEAENSPALRPILLRPNPSVLNELIELGLLQASDRENTEAVKIAVIQLLDQGRRALKIARLADEMIGELAAALGNETERWRTRKAPDRDIIIDSLEAVLFFLGRIPALRRARLLWPLGMLFNDLRQLNRGQVTDLFQPPRKHGAPPASGTYNGLKGLAVFVAERLEASGKKREDAWKKVADELARMRVKPARKGARDIDHIIPRTIKKWHEDISADIAGTSEASRFFAQCEADHSEAVLRACGLNELPNGSTIDGLYVERFGADAYHNLCLRRLRGYVRAFRLGKST